MTDDTPEYTLLSLYDDDTMAALCHWHHPPTDDEVSDMISTIVNTESLKGVLIAQTIAFRKVTIQ